jgi:hypothetical protein
MQTDLPGALGADYARDAEHRPLAGYAAISGAFAAALAAALLSGRPLPERIDARDLLLAGVATHKVSRLIAKDKVTSFLRAPFTRFQEPAGHGELEEAPRGRGMQYAIGELLVCPYCMAQWVAGGFAVGHLFAPRTTRLLSAMWAAQAIADGVQLGYSAGEQQT